MPGCVGSTSVLSEKGARIQLAVISDLEKGMFLRREMGFAEAKRVSCPMKKVSGMPGF